MKKIKRVSNDFAHCIFEYNGKLVQVIGYINREKVIIFTTIREKDGEHCPHCGKYIKPCIWHEVENCRNFQKATKKVDSLKID